MIIPSLLTTNERIAVERIALAQNMSGWLHVDVLDNSLYPYTTLPIEALEELEFGELHLEAHCMTNNPLAVAESLLPLERLIIHYELPDWRHHYDVLVSKGIDTWLSIAPTTAIESVQLPEDLHGVLLMGVVPGQSGQAIDTTIYDRLDALKDYYPNITISVDGGVDETTIRQLIAHGADNVVMANAIFSDANPVQKYEQVAALSDPIGGLDDNQGT